MLSVNVFLQPLMFVLYHFVPGVCITFRAESVKESDSQELMCIDASLSEEAIYGRPIGKQFLLVWCA